MDMSNVTIAFAGFNMRHFAVLAIESFLYHYPELRSNIVFFDDNSTDKTVKDLQRRGIKVITWRPELFNQYMKLKNEGYLTCTTKIMSSRVCYIMREIMEQVETKYLLMSDGDVIFLKGGFLEGYLKNLNNSDTKIMFHEEHSMYPGLTLENLKGINDKQLEYYQRYQIIYTEEVGPNFTQKEIDSKVYGSRRVHLLHAIMDLEYFKKIDMLGDRLTKDTFDLMDGGLVDTGTDFFHQLMDEKIPFEMIEHEKVIDILIHWGWISSSNRDVDKNNQNSRRNQTKEIEEILRLPEVQKILNEINYGNGSRILNTFKRDMENKFLY